MARKCTPTYTIEFPLYILIWQQHRLEKKFNIARMVYNSCLGEALKRHKTVKSDKRYRALLNEPKSKERHKKLADIRLEYSFSEYGIHHFVKKAHRVSNEEVNTTREKLVSLLFSYSCI